ncbi:gas vesicle protein GvpO [Brevibacterium sediminis]|uniref:gas vesicle protein GvpO n=1 Tax=Brevibacterium sediminis TaxID=1857024 RepID=UPI002174D4E6|nr:gas vesicle protein [Brevibacterium sediminis]
MSEESEANEESRAESSSADDGGATTKRARKPAEKERTTEGTSRRSSGSVSASHERPTSREKAASTSRSKSGSHSATGQRISAVKAAKKAIEQFSTLTGRPPESVVGTRWHDDHWSVRLEVVESRRIPDSADLLAEYQVELDGAGELMAYDRKDRYVRGRPSE